MNHEISVIGLILEASLLVKLVMLILVGMSILSWAVILKRSRILKSAEKNLVDFEQKLNSASSKVQLFKDTHAKTETLEGSEAIFHAGYYEYYRINQIEGASADALLTGSDRAMRVKLAKEMEQLEQQLPFLATVGSISPYIGLFGTVWGIMTAFIALGAVKQATLAMVAPGIAEALIATAMGLFAAIPAVMAFNRLSNKVNLLEQGYANFAEQVQGELHRQSVTDKKA